jgi:hypothetical protein
MREAPVRAACGAGRCWLETKEIYRLFCKYAGPSCTCGASLSSWRSGCLAIGVAKQKAALVLALAASDRRDLYYGF